MSDPASALANVPSAISSQLYADVKSWLVSLASGLRRLVKKSNAQRFESPVQLLDAIQAGGVVDGEVVVLTCKPSLFGPFLRWHFLPPLSGMNTSQRLGPRVNMGNGPMSFMFHTSSNLTPVGLYPPLPGGLSQVCLYASDALAAGFVSLLPNPQVDRLTQYMPAIFAARHTPHCQMPCHVTGTVRLVAADALVSAGHTIETYEEIRQLGTTWVLDVTGDESACAPMSDGTIGEFWGGLYASGHLQLPESGLEIASVIDVLQTAVSTQESPAQVIPNRAGRKEISIFGTGIRACLDTQVPVYSVHMDAELGISFSDARKRFDATCQNILAGIDQACRSKSIPLGNPFDLDFTYTNGAKAYSVLRSASAENVQDPILTSIRDWHRLREARR